MRTEKHCIQCGGRFFRRRYKTGFMEKQSRFESRSTCGEIDCLTATRARRNQSKTFIDSERLGPRRDLFSEKLYRDYTRRIAKLPRKKRIRAYVRST